MLESIVRAAGHSTDKLESGYLPYYDAVLAPLRARDIRLLELGVKAGASLRLWRDYFPRGIIAGVDLQPPVMQVEPRVRLFAGRQEDVVFLDRVAAEIAPDGFDVIIDDCSHMGKLTEVSFWHLFRKHLKAGGIYVIEDWGTGYMPGWPDGAAYREAHVGNPRRGLRSSGRLARIARSVRGPVRLRSHDAGMVGFVKRLVDECGRPDHSGERSAFESMDIRPGLVTVRKAGAE